MTVNSIPEPHQGATSENVDVSLFQEIIHNSFAESSCHLHLCVVNSVS